MVNLKRLFLFGSMAAITHVHAQITIQAVVMQGELVAPATLFRATVLNSTSVSIVHFEGALRTANGEAVLSLRSEPIALQPGIRTISSAELMMREFTYAANDAGRSAKLFQRLPGGDYTYCITVKAESTEGSDQFCDALTVDELLFLDLVMPWNGDSIEETRPALTWTVSGTPMATSTTRVRITVVPMPKGMNAAQAIASEVPVFNVPDVAQRTLAYPPGVPDLLRGKCYAWQAERIVNDRVLDRSEPWSFCVRQHLEPMPEKYVRLDRVEPGSVYRVVDRHIYFRYDEPYASPDMQCSIVGPDGKRVVPSVANESAGQAVAGTRAAGANLFDLDLSPYALKAGAYDLVVIDGKGHRYELHFEMPR